MPFSYCLRPLLLGSLIGGLCVGQGRAQTLPAADSAGTRLPTWVWKGGLRLTHLSYSRTTTNWRLLVPASLGAEYRLASCFSFYAQLDADMQLNNVSARRRGRRGSAGASTGAGVPAATVELGGRWYYGRPAGPVVRQPGTPEFGKYLALAVAGEWANAANGTTVYYGRGQRGASGRLTPSLYALWGIQNRPRPHLLYDLNAGLGVLAPSQARSSDYPLANQHWDVGAQVNVRVYWAR